MTTTVISSNTTTQFSFNASDDTLIVDAGATIASQAGAAAYAFFGADNLAIEGSIVGAYGFEDNTAAGSDRITVGVGGGIVGTTQIAIEVQQGGNYIQNLGSISSLLSDAITLGAGNLIVNQGSIYGLYEAISDGGSDHIVNNGFIGDAYYQYSTISEGSGGNSLVNTGTITANGGFYVVTLAGGNNVIANSGTISGGDLALDCGDGGDTIANSGSIIGLQEAILIAGTIGTSTVRNSGLISSAAVGGAAVEMAGADDNMFNSGTIEGAVQFEGGLATFQNAGSVVGNVAFSGDGNSYQGASGSVSGTIFASGSHGTYIGGASGATFEIATAQLTTNDIIVGGASGRDTLIFSGAGSITMADLKHVSGIETFDLASDDVITLNQAIANTAAGSALTVDASATGHDVVNLTQILSPADRILVWAQGGDDAIIAGASFDTFRFADVADSTGAKYDTIAAVNFARDKFDGPGAPGSVKAINAAVKTGALSTATFDANLAADLGPSKLGASDAVLFTASAGTLKGDTFLVVDMNGAAGYQAGQDLVVRLIGGTGTLTAGNFI